MASDAHYAIAATRRRVANKATLELTRRCTDRVHPTPPTTTQVPEAWQDNDQLTDEKKAFYEYHSCLMEPWDGPALIAFTDSNKWIGATLDRNGLRPARYYETHDGQRTSLVGGRRRPLGEAGGNQGPSRLEPGKMFLVDLEEGRIIPDDEIKSRVSTQKPLPEWLSTHTHICRIGRPNRSRRSWSSTTRRRREGAW